MKSLKKDASLFEETAWTNRQEVTTILTQGDFIINNIDERIQKPCANQLLKKLYKANAPVQWDSFEKEPIDEIIFRTTKLPNRLILELMARGGMRIGEVLTLTPDNIVGQKLLIRDPKSGREQEIIFITQKTAEITGFELNFSNLNRKNMRID